MELNEVKEVKVVISEYPIKGPLMELLMKYDYLEESLARHYF